MIAQTTTDDGDDNIDNGADANNGNCEIIFSGNNFIKNMIEMSTTKWRK